MTANRVRGIGTPLQPPPGPVNRAVVNRLRAIYVYVYKYARQTANRFTRLLRRLVSRVGKTTRPTAAIH